MQHVTCATFGRVACTTGEEGTGLLFYEKMHLDATQQKKTAEKQKPVGDGGGPPTKKRAVLVIGGGTSTVPAASRIPSDDDQVSVTDPELIPKTVQ